MKGLMMLFALFSPGLTFINPLIKTNGDPDITSIVNHVTLLEQTVANIQQSVQSEARANVAQFAVLQNEVNQLRTDIKASQTEVQNLRKTVLSQAVSLNQTSEMSEMAAVKSDVIMLKTNVSKLMSAVTKNKHSLKNVSDQLNVTHTTLNNLTAQVKLSIKDVGSPEKEISSLRTRMNQCCNILNNTSSMVDIIKQQYTSVKNRTVENNNGLAILTNIIKEVTTKLSAAEHGVSKNAESLVVLLKKLSTPTTIAATTTTTVCTDRPGYGCDSRYCQFVTLNDCPKSCYLC